MYPSWSAPPNQQNSLGRDNDMPNVRKRIEVLERAFLPIQYLPADDMPIAELMRLLSDEDLDTLIAANEAQKEGLPLNGRQMAAQRAFARVVAQCRFADSPA